ncbi:MAG: DNA repair protein RecN [Prevotella sp.]|nr:DNA repair protein RecN [Prevotella sp.]
MLKELYIKNFTLIDLLDVKFSQGFSAITGETGAGKSIILGAINLLMGQRADAKSIREGESSCVVEAHFDIKGIELKAFFSENDIEYDESDLILRREISSSGKSRAFINDSPVQLSQMKTIATRLIDIHSQHQNLALSQENFQLSVVDIIAKDEDLLFGYKESFQQYLSSKKQTKDLEEKISLALKNEDYLRFQLEELENVNLSEGIQAELEAERDKLSHVEDIKTALYSSDEILNASEASDNLLDKLREVTKTLDGIKEIYPDVKDIAERIDGCYIELKDISREISFLKDDVDFDPKRLETISSELDKLYSLQKKHGLSSDKELLEMRSSLREQLSKIENQDTELELLKKREKECLERSRKLAEQLSSLREKAAKKIELEIKDKLIELGIPNVRFLVQIEKGELSLTGQDRITFLFSANKSSTLQALSQVASGGEISRLMLSLKAMISDSSSLPTIIFDEIDTGVSGKIAQKMADIMKQMSVGRRQVISITHLPQIAAGALLQYKVEKEETSKGTQTSMKILSKEERIHEIAQMLSGEKVTSAALDNAKELLKNNIDK